MMASRIPKALFRFVTSFYWPAVIVTVVVLLLVFHLIPSAEVPPP